MGERRNLELKARDPDPEATARACRRLGADDAGTLVQRDTYFRVPGGRLKLREEEGGTAELIHYERPDVEGVRTSRYRRVELERSEALRELLAAALGVVGVVEKRRRLFLLGHVRIHLDDVERLGTFVELEAVLPESEEAGDDAEVMRLAGALGIAEGAVVAGSYLDLLLAAGC